MKRFLQLICCVALLASCEQGGNDVNMGNGTEIAFNAESVVRSVITQENIDAGQATVKVCATRDGSAFYTNEALVRENTGKWYPQSGKDSWDDNRSYSFYGYASNTTNGLNISDNGLSITVNQPTSYDASKMVDYLLSYKFDVANGSMRPIVQLQLEHAMSLVEIYVVRGNNFDARLTSMVFENIYSSASLRCTTHAKYNEEKANVWEISPTGNNTTKYTINPNPAIVIGDTREETEAKMTIMCIPQQLTSNTKLTINYEVNEQHPNDTEDNWVAHTETFQLYNYDPISYKTGHRIIYTATIDSGVNLQGVIAEWKNVDYIEGTILPEIPTGDDTTNDEENSDESQN